MSTTEITKSPPRKAAQVPFAKKAAKVKAANEAKRPQPHWLRRPQHLPAPSPVTPLTPERERAADRSQGPPRLLNKAEVCAITGFSFPTIWTHMREGRFPRARVIGSGGSSKSVWLSTEIEAWMAALPKRRLKGDPEAA